jgi:16S rRNA (adenine1518-N6/adenine1519-N6)-dimethyltransferase
MKYSNLIYFMQVKAKKYLGQNFLKDDAILERIVESAQISSTDVVVEIGPGTGLLTKVLSGKAERVISLEVDSDLIPGLLKQFPLSSNVSIIHQDILKADLMEILQISNTFTPPPTPTPTPTPSSSKEGRNSYKVVANIPYYITAPIIQYLLELPVPPKMIVLMIQKEVAERITAKVGDMSILAVSVQYYADPEVLFIVSKTAFNPVPKVDSAVVRIIPRRTFNKKQDKLFFRVVKTGFSARRKTLINNLSSGFHLSKEDVAQKLAQIGFDANIRAQALSIDDWKRVVETI